MRLFRLAAAAPLVAALLAPPLPTSAVARTASAQAAPCRALTVRQRAAQTVATGVPGTTATRTARRLVARHAGAVLLLGRNVGGRRQLRRLTAGLRAAAPHRLLVGVDEEGGRVARLGAAGLVDHLPSARWLAGHRRPAYVRRRGERLGAQMLALGVDWNLAPVLDVAAAPRGTVIGDRAYSGRPAVVAAYGSAFAEGLRAAGVLTTGKHFPGHGRTRVDSHERLPTVTAPLARLRRVDLRPYRAAMPFLDAVMTAHVRYPALDGRRPASLSRPVTGLLRRDLGFDGLVVTDALEMGAITDRHPVPEAAELALRAGADLALVGDWRSTRATTDRLVAAVRAGRLGRHRLDAAARRVLTAKGYTAEEIGCLLGAPSG